MFRRKRILSLGSITLLLLSSLLFVAHTKLTPIAHAATCNTVARDSSGETHFYASPYWGNNCSVSTTENSDSNFVEAIQEIVNAQVDGATGQHLCGTLNVDGDFGPATLMAVQCFQKLYSQSYTGGIVGQETWINMAQFLDSTDCPTCGSRGGWTYFSADGTTPDFRVYSDAGTDEGAWYVNPGGAGTWCEMDTSDSCE